MKTTKKIRRITEPLVYIVLVAAFGFITTVVNHTDREERIRNAELVSLDMQSQLEAMITQSETGVSL